MISRTEKRDNQARYIRNNHGQRYFTPDQIDQDRWAAAEKRETIDPHKYDHLIPVANKALKFTLKASWFVMKKLVKAAFAIPRAFSKMGSKAQNGGGGVSSARRNPSPDSAFPAP